MLAFTFVMLGLHTMGTPLIYAYLFFWKHHSGLRGVGRVNKHKGSGQVDLHAHGVYMYIYSRYNMCMCMPLHKTARASSLSRGPCTYCPSCTVLEALKEQELSDYYQQKLEETKAYTNNVEKIKYTNNGAPMKSRIGAEEVLPGYMLKLTGGYEYRTYSFELFETIRKVALVSGG